MFRVKALEIAQREFRHMKVSREQVEDNRRTLLTAAGRLFRERGFDGVTVADVMQAAGLTHGGFYGYFASKDDLIAATLQTLLASPSRESAELGRYASGYLTPAHRDNSANGCPVAALGADSIRQSPKARAAMTAGLRDTIDRLSRCAPGADDTSRRQAAIGGWAALVGAMVLARMADDPELSDEVLSATAAWVGRQAPQATSTSDR